MHVHAPRTGKAASRTSFVLCISLAATLAYVAVTFVAGLRAHSLALLSESGHNASDFLALLLSFAAVYFQSRPADHARTFGYQRAGVLAAFINAATLIAISLWIGVEAVHRLSSPVAVQPRIMMIVAAAGGVLFRGGGAEGDHEWCGCCRGGYERRDCRAAMGSGARCEPAQRIRAYGRRHAFDTHGACRRPRDFADWPPLD